MPCRHVSLVSASVRGRAVACLATLCTVLLAALPLRAQDAASPPQGAHADLLRSVVHLRAHIAPNSSSSSTLGTTREGNGVLIDSSGLVVTIGYLINQAYAIQVIMADGKEVGGTFVGYDHESGFGLLRAQVPADTPVMRLGDSDQTQTDTPSLVLAASGPLPAQPVQVVSRRPFAGYWEYLLEDAIFTAPPQPRFGGAALVSSDGRLVGIGSLLVSDAAGPRIDSPGNMFVPINRLKPLMAELMELGRPASPGPPWLGITTLEVADHVVIRRVSHDGPAARAGVRAGDVILGIGEDPVGDTIDFLRRVRALGGPGTPVPLVIARRNAEGATLERITVTAASRYDWMEPARGL